MRRSGLWESRWPAIVTRKWFCGLLACGISFGLLALAAGGDTGERSHQDRPGVEDRPAAATGTDTAYSGAGNLVPLW
jgi:hypothetical protein